MKATWRAIAILSACSLLFVGAALVTLRAAERSTVAPPVAAPPAAPQPHPAPSVPDESATILDDPTVAPDPAESADHTVSFPTDI